MGYYVINPKDNVKVNLENGHKYALRNIKKGEEIIKYGFPIGVATENIPENVHIHSHNLKTLLSGIKEYTYNPCCDEIKLEKPITIEAFIRKNGDIGIRNDIWIINTVGCINKTAEKIANTTNSFAFPHPYGCSQLGEDYLVTQKILCGLIKHPNAGGVLVLGLGCENNNIPELKKVLGEYDDERVRFLNIQDCEDEIEEAVKIIDELKKSSSEDLKKFNAKIINTSLPILGVKTPSLRKIADRVFKENPKEFLKDCKFEYFEDTLIYGLIIAKLPFDEFVERLDSYLSKCDSWAHIDSFVPRIKCAKKEKEK